MASKKELPEKDFIHEEYSKRPYLLWTFLVLILIIMGLFWLISAWQGHIIQKRQDESPFLQVTNREFSFFLWQNPHLMRAHRKNKLGYLPEFSSDDDVRVIPALADRYVSAPPEILYFYHTWNRLLGDSLAPRPISSKLFRTFLRQNPEWLPENWAGASEEYTALVERLPDMDEDNIAADLPFLPAFAFQGWNNYFREREAIEEMRPTGEQMRLFLENHPHYNRNYWRNILADSRPNYLRSFLYGPSTETGDPEVPLPDDEFSSFLKVGIFNYSKTTKPSS